MTQRNVSLVIADYLDRIGLAGVPEVDSDVELVRRLADAQHRAIPFDNMLVHLGGCFTVDPVVIVDRLVERRLGGVCYQLNGLLAMVLERLGVEARLWGARVRSERGLGPEGGHMAVVIDDEDGGEILVDVGFGGEAIWQRVDAADPASLHVTTGGAGYHLIPRARTLDEFDDVARWHSSSSESRITASVVCTLPRDGGRVTLAGRLGADRVIDYRLIELAGDDRVERPVPHDELAAVLATEFGIAEDEAPRISRVVEHRRHVAHS
ncbi:MAG: arylamine N-acetyltransferase [Gordonia sp. (in: high G+C Gram-positive bacteria)]|uniref:arylamine N-acetyltransferase family protein n=1 Tax=Gordonia sp. (in: high G+C Gram-positive bacteria) TaxID=84139 RepID=UPI0039E3C2F7